MIYIFRDPATRRSHSYTIDDLRLFIEGVENPTLTPLKGHEADILKWFLSTTSDYANELLDLKQQIEELTDDFEKMEEERDIAESELKRVEERLETAEDRVFELEEENEDFRSRLYDIKSAISDFND